MAVRRWGWGDDPTIIRGALDAGRVVAIPTESSYGLAAYAESAAGVAAVFAIKGRSGAEPLPVLVAEPSQIARWTPAAKTPGLCEIAALWPAALTLVVDIAEPIAASAGQRSLAVRVPAHARLRGLLADVDLPVTATSANRSGKPSLCDPDEVAHLLAQTDAVVIDDGPLPGGPPSTLVRYDAATAGFNVLREGAYPPHLLRNTGR